jgi:DNA invertase Pin-like site-specific DNA recombinase
MKPLCRNSLRVRINDSDAMPTRVLFWSLDRFGREGALPTLMYLNELDASGFGYKSYTEQFLDSMGIFKDAIISMLAVLAKQEKIKIEERTKAGMARARANGSQIGPPSKSQDIVVRIQQMKGEGNSNYAVAKALNISANTVAKYVRQFAK